MCLFSFRKLFVTCFCCFFFFFVLSFGNGKREERWEGKTHGQLFGPHKTKNHLLAASEEYGDSGTTQKKDVKKTPATRLPSTLSRHCMCTISSFLFVNNHGKQI